MGSTTWNSGCKSWYLTNDGYNGTMYPGFATQFKRALSKVDMGDYVATPVTARPDRKIGYAQNGSKVANIGQGRKGAGVLAARPGVDAGIADVGVGEVPPKRAASKVRKDAMRSWERSDQNAKTIFGHKRLDFTHSANQKEKTI